MLAPHTRPRAAVTVIGRGEPESGEDVAPDGAPASSPPPDPEPAPPPSPASPARMGWAQLLARIFEVLPRLYPACGGEMRIIAFITDAPALEAILLQEIALRPAKFPDAQANGPMQSRGLLIHCWATLGPSTIAIDTIEAARRGSDRAGKGAGWVTLGSGGAWL